MPPATLPDPENNRTDNESPSTTPGNLNQNPIAISPALMQQHYVINVAEAAGDEEELVDNNENAPLNGQVTQNYMLSYSVRAMGVMATVASGIIAITSGSDYKQDITELNAELNDCTSIWNSGWSETYFGSNPPTCSGVFKTWKNISDMPCSDLIQGFSFSLPDAFNKTCVPYFSGYCDNLDFINKLNAPMIDFDLNWTVGSAVIAASAAVIVGMEFTRYKPTQLVRNVASNAATGLTRCVSSLFHRSNANAASSANEARAQPLPLTYGTSARR